MTGICGQRLADPDGLAGAQQPFVAREEVSAEGGLFPIEEREEAGGVESRLGAKQIDPDRDGGGAAGGIRIDARVGENRQFQLARDRSRRWNRGWRRDDG